MLSCAPDSTPAPEQSPAQAILGEWAWVKTVSYAWTYSEATPASVGYEVTLKFKADSIMEAYQDDSLVNTAPYKVFYVKTGSPTPNSDSTLVFDITNISVVPLSIKNDTLILDASPVDGPVQYYTRKK